MRLLCRCLSVLVLAGLYLPIHAAADEIKHSFLGFGKANGIVLVAEDGSVEWKLQLPASDGWMLEEDRVLVAVYPTRGFRGGGVIIVNRSTGKREFEYQGQQKEISTAVQLENGNIVLTELGPKPRAVEVDRTGTIVRETPLQCQKENVHMQTRMLRVLSNGNYLVPHLLDFAVKEYVPGSGKVVRVFRTDDRGRDKRDWPFTAIRLADGNTLIGCTNGNRVIEVDEQGQIVWKVDNDDLKRPLIDDACGVQRLPNGNTVIASYHAKGNRVKLLEVTREKEVVWTFSGMRAGFHHFQILTTNGQPVTPNTLR